MSTKNWGELSSTFTGSPLGGPVFTEGSAIYLDSADGNDSTGTGTRSNPYKTIEKGITSAADAGADIIILMSGFNETVTSALTAIANTESALIICGEGTGSSRAKLINNVAAASAMMRVTTGDRVRIQNINFAASTLGAAIGDTISVTGSGGLEIVDCNFDLTQYTVSTYALIAITGGHVTIRDCTFAATSALAAAGNPCIYAGGGGMTVEGCTFNGGGYGRMEAIADGGGTLNHVFGCTLTSDAHITFGSTSGSFVAFDDASDIGTDCSVDVG